MRREGRKEKREMGAKGGRKDTFISQWVEDKSGERKMVEVVKTCYENCRLFKEKKDVQLWSCGAQHFQSSQDSLSQLIQLFLHFYTCVFTRTG